MNSHRWGFWSIFFVILLSALIVAGGATAQLDNYVQGIARHVTLDDDGYRVEITTFENNVAELLSRYDITLGPGDEITPNLGTPLQKYTKIRIKRAMPVWIEADGKKKNIHVTEGTVQDVLNKAEVTVREKDQVNQPLTDPVKPYDRIKVTRMDENILIEKEPIPYQVYTRENSQMNEGVSKVVQEGKQGERQRKIQITYRDGVEVSRSLAGEEVTVSPVDHIVEKGTKKKQVPNSRGGSTRPSSASRGNTTRPSAASGGAASRGDTTRSSTASKGDAARYSEPQTMVATAYTAGSDGIGITASGTTARPHHTIAAPPDVPIGTKVYIPELVAFCAQRGITIDGIFTVEDRGGGIKGDKIDVFMEDIRMARIWGRRKVKVHFIK